MCLSRAPGQAELTFPAQKGSQASRVRCFPLSVGKGSEWCLSPVPLNISVPFRVGQEEAGVGAMRKEHGLWHQARFQTPLLLLVMSVTLTVVSSP